MIINLDNQEQEVRQDKVCQTQDRNYDRKLSTKLGCFNKPTNKWKTKGPLTAFGCGCDTSVVLITATPQFEVVLDVIPNDLLLCRQTVCGCGCESDQPPGCGCESLISVVLAKTLTICVPIILYWG